LRPERKNDLPAYTVVIDDVSGGDIANILRGYIVVAGQKIRFTGIAYGRYGGQNVAPRLSRVAKKKLKEVFGDLPKFEEDLQMKLVSGEFEIKPKAGVMPPQ
jgi:hypothetical protein